MHSQIEVLNGDAAPKVCGCDWCCLFDRNLPVNNDAGDDVNAVDSISKNILLLTVHTLLFVVDLWRLSQLPDNDLQLRQSLVVIFVRRFVCQTVGLLSATVVTVGMVTSPFGEFGDKICIDDGASNNEPWSMTDKLINASTFNRMGEWEKLTNFNVTATCTCIPLAT